MVQRLLILFCGVIFSQLLSAQSARNSFYTTNQEPLVAQPYTALPLGAIQAKGWLRKMLETRSLTIPGISPMHHYKSPPKGEKFLNGTCHKTLRLKYLTRLIHMWN